MTTPFRLSLGKVLPLAFLATSILAPGLRGASAETGDNFRVNAVNWYRTGDADPTQVPQVGDVLQTGQRIETVTGQQLQLTIGRNTIAFAPRTVVIIGDDDPSTPIGTFQLISGSISVTVKKDDFATFDTPRLRASSTGADFIIRTTDEVSEVSVIGGAVTVASLATGASTDVGAKMVAIVGRKDLNDRARRADPVVLPVMHPARAVALVPQPGNDKNGPYAHWRIADQAWVTRFIREDKATSTWIVKGISSSAGFNADGKHPFDALPRPGTVLAAGMAITTSAHDEVQLTNGHDLVTMQWNTTLVMGDGDPATAEPDFKLVAGAINTEVSKHESGQPIVIDATYLRTTLENAHCMIVAQPARSSIIVTDGKVVVASLASGDTKTITAGQSAFVKPAQHYDHRHGPAGKPSLRPVLEKRDRAACETAALLSPQSTIGTP